MFNTTYFPHVKLLKGELPVLMGQQYHKTFLYRPHSAIYQQQTRNNNLYLLFRAFFIIDALWKPLLSFVYEKSYLTLTTLKKITVNINRLL